MIKNVNRGCDARLMIGPMWIVFLSATLAFAADKNGVSPMAISRPSGPGSLEGLGDSFQPTLNTGTARYTVTLDVPEGVTGFSPGLALKYDSGKGCGTPGMGWSMEVGHIRRQTDEGQPQYFDAPLGTQPTDRFLGSDGEEIVPLENGYYLSKTEGLFARYRRVGDAWEAISKSGIRSEFGLTSDARVQDSTGKKVYKWYLERQTDTHGNVIEYSYQQLDPTSRQVYPTEIRYGPGSSPWIHSYRILISYENRPDLWTDYRAGFKVAMTQRIHQIDMFYDDAMIRRYALTYETDPNQSLLTTITQIGADGVSSLPTTRFGYATFPLGNPDIPIDATPGVIGSVNEPSSVLDSSRVEIIDLNADGLPDLLNTDAVHLAHINRGVQTLAGKSNVFWEGPIAVTTEDGVVQDYRLSDGIVHLADMTGDGTADWIVTGTDGIDCFANTGRIGWATRRRVAVQKFPPPAPYASPDGSVRSTDVDFDKKMDVIKSEDGAYSVWVNQNDGQFSDRILTPGARFKGKFVHFANRGVQLADMNGDRLADVVEVTSHSVVFCPSMGFGQFDECEEMSLPFTDPALEQEQIDRAKVIDINGDGLSDLVVERFSGTNLRFWLHLPTGDFARSRLITGLPATPNSATRWADINGNGTVDLIYADSTLQSSKINSVDIGELVAGSSHYNALTSIDNGYGRRTDILYRSITEFYLDASVANNPWNLTLPFPMPVVSQSRTTIGLDLDGHADEGPRGDTYITDYVYRDGYYDPLREQFRGFSFVKEIVRGDERFGGNLSPTLVTRFSFHTGAPDGIDNDGNGMTDESGQWNGREEEPLKGVELWRETTTLPDDPTRDGSFAEDPSVFERTENSYVVRLLCTDIGGALVDLFGNGYRSMDRYGRVVRLLVPSVSRRTIIERGAASAKMLEMRTDLDAIGNKRVDWNLGDLSNPNDDLHTLNEYAYNEPAWFLDRSSRTVMRDGGPDGAIISDLRHFYDGPPFVGLPLGQIGARGLLHRKEACLTFGSVQPLTERSFALGDPRDPSGRINLERHEFDAYGNLIVSLDADATLAPKGLPTGSGHERRMEIDPDMHKFTTREIVSVGGGSPDLATAAEYDYRFQTPIKMTDWNGHATHFVLDAFGRLERETLPGDDPANPTMRYTYDLGEPYSVITTTKHLSEGDSQDVVTSTFYDGMGRALGTFEAGGPVMSNVKRYGPRGKPVQTLQPYFGSPPISPDTWTLPVGNVPFSTTRYDATLRTIETISPPDMNGEAAVSRLVFLPLAVDEYDSEDNLPGGEHEGTFRTLLRDGLDRLVEVRERENRSLGDTGVFTTRYRYAMPNRIAEIEDAKGNVKYFRYDGLGRRIFMNDCNRGQVETTYDSFGNVVRTVDAKGQVVVNTYDGVNRLLTEDYLDSATPLSLNRSPDVFYHYDSPSPSYPTLPNLRGQLAWIEDLTGAEFHGFNAR
ncbi:MAG: SpvB/TcaC N-terminal domain-containing protein, partial [Planctomycetota bacterium]